MVAVVIPTEHNLSGRLVMYPSWLSDVSFRRPPSSPKTAPRLCVRQVDAIAFAEVSAGFAIPVMW